MSDRTRACRTGAILIALLLLAPVTASAQGGAGDSRAVPPENVQLTFRLGRVEDGARMPLKTYVLIVAAGTPGSTLLSGERVPIPVTDGAGEPGDAAGRRFVYQNIGFTTAAEARIDGDGRIHLIANLEDSRVREDDAGGPPTVETRQLTVNAILDSGQPLELTRVEIPDEVSGYVEVEARILR